MEKITKLQQKSINYNIQIQMSQLIDLQYPPTYPHLFYKQKIKSIIKTTIPSCKNIIDNDNTITFFIKCSQYTYRFSTIWIVDLTTDNFVIQIKFYNKEENDLLRVYNSRTKIQLGILIRRINLLIMPFCCFGVEQSGVLKLVYLATFQIDNVMRNQDLHKIILELFKILKLYDQLMIFVQPHINVKQAKESNSEKNQSPYLRINKIRCLLKNTKNTRNQIQAPFWDMIRVKTSNQQFQQNQIQQLGQMYMQNIIYFQRSQIGLQHMDQFTLDKKIFSLQLFQKKVQQKCKTNSPSNNNKQKDLDKILYGLIWIKTIDKQCKNQQQIQQKQLKQQQNLPFGSHSQILSKKFQYWIDNTIHAGVGADNNMYKENQKKKQGQLIYKTCNTNAQTSINSFKNQLNFLKYVRDMNSPYIARYYLLVKQQWNEKDTIYMNKYKQNIYELITRRRTLSLRTKLQLSYRIAKGLCFLYSKQILHRDFKPQNIVVDSYLTPKIIDFGSCSSHYKKKAFQQKFKPHDQRLLSTPGFHISYKKAIQQNPEIMKKISKKQYEQHQLFDVYGLGKTINFIFFGTIQLPHPQNYQNQVYFEIYQNLIFLLQMCNNYDPDDRPSLGQITLFLGILNNLIIQKFGFIENVEKQISQQFQHKSINTGNKNNNISNMQKQQ